MDDERDAEDAIRSLDRYEFGRQGRRLRVEWTKQERGGRRSAGSRRSSANLKPTKTLFVINFDPIHTRTRDLERHFDPFGKILNIRIRRNFAFIQYESQEEATKALDATNMSKLMDRVISVEYAVRDDDDKRNGYSPERRGRGRSPDRIRDRRRSPSPYQRERGSPDYGRSASPIRRSRDRMRSPSPYRRERGSPDYGRRLSRERSRDRVQSPGLYQRDRGSPDYGHGISPERRSHDRVRSPAPYDRERRSRDHVQSPAPYDRERRSRDRVQSPAPYDRAVSPERGSPERESRDHVQSPAPYQREEGESPGPYQREEGESPGPYQREEGESLAPYQRERGDSYGGDPSPNTKPDRNGSPSYERTESPAYEKNQSPPEES